MSGVQVDLISKERLEKMTSMEKIRMILDQVKNGVIVVLEKGLTPEEQAKLIEMTMLEIDQEEFVGIEIESYMRERQKPGLLDRLFGRSPFEGRLTMIGPANQLKTIKKEEDLISALISAGN
jgi:hypothetical protein